MGEVDRGNARQSTPRRSLIPPLAPRGSPPPNPTVSSSSTAPSRGQQTLAGIAFPPQLTEVQAIIDGIAEHSETSSLASCQGGEEAEALRAWRDELLELLAAVSRGSSSTSDAPVEDVWHWLAADERLTRSQAFVEHAAVTAVVSRATALGGQENDEAVSRWHAATKQLKQLQKESSWNAQYLRVVEEPLSQLSSSDVIHSNALPSLVKRVMRSLHRIFHSSDYFKEHRMASLLHKILKELVRQTGRHVPSPFEVARPRVGFGAAIRAAGEMRDTFRAFADNFFLAQSASNSAAQSSTADRRPATAQGTAGERSSSNSRRKDPSSDLGWWRATVRTCLEHAEYCCRIAERIQRLLEDSKWLTSTLLSLRRCDPELLQQVEGFLELHSGVKGGGDMHALLDLKRRVELDGQIREVERRLQTFISKAKEVGAESREIPEEFVVETEGGGQADVLTIPEESTTARSATCEDIQGNISNLREELRQFGSQLENLSDMVKQKTALRPMNFTPLPRASAETASCEQGVEEVHRAKELAEKSAALEVAKRSSWYRAAAPVLPEGTELISVRQNIELTPVSDLPDRPRSAQPCLVGRPATAPALRGGRPPSSRQAVIAQRLGYTALDDQGCVIDIYSTAAAGAVNDGANIEPCPEHEHEDQHQGESGCTDNQEQEGAACRVMMSNGIEGNGGLAEISEDAEFVATDTAQELPDCDEDPFCNTAVSWRVT